MITQQELDEEQRKNILINRSEVIDVVKKNFQIAFDNLKVRCQYDQTIVGNLLTVLETELKKELKNIKHEK